MEEEKRIILNEDISLSIFFDASNKRIKINNIYILRQLYSSYKTMLSFMCFPWSFSFFVLSFLLVQINSINSLIAYLSHFLEKCISFFTRSLISMVFVLFLSNYSCDMECIIYIWKCDIYSIKDLWFFNIK